MEPRKKDAPTVDGKPDEKADASYIRQSMSSLSMRGRFKDCFKLFEENIRLLYFGERWPENFYAGLLVHKKCSDAMELSQPYEAYLSELLKKNGIPAVLSKMAATGSYKGTWTADSFKDLALSAREGGELSEALDYADLMIKTDPFNSNAVLIKGWILQDLERADEAAACFERALEIKDVNYHANAGLAEYYMSRDTARALECVHKAIRQAPDEAGFQALKARILLAAGDRQGAMNAYDDAIAIDPLTADYSFQKAELLLADGQNIAAAREYAKVVQADKAHLKALVRLSGLLRESRPDQALAYASAALALQPENSEASLIKAQLLEKSGQFVQAIRQYRTTIQLDPACHAAYGALGALYLDVNPEQALSMFEQAVEMSPRNAQYRLGKAGANEKLGNTEAAVSDYKQTLAMDKACAPAYAALGGMFRERDPKTALKYYDRALAIVQDNPNYYREKAELLLSLGKQTKAAAECYVKAVQLKSTDAKLRMSLAAILEELGGITSAIEHYRAAAGLEPDNAQALYSLARLQEYRNPVEALRDVNRAITLDPAHGEFHYLKARLCAGFQRRPEAMAVLRRTIDSLEDEDEDTLREFNVILAGEAFNLAMRSINLAIQISPGNAAYLSVRADLMFDMNQAAKALEEYRKVLKADPECHEAWYGQGRLLAAKNDPAALECLDKAIALSPGNTAYLSEKADYLAKDPLKYEQALEYYDAAIALDHSLWEVMRRKAMLLEERGDYPSARDQYRRVLLVNPDCVQGNIRMGVLLSVLNPTAALEYLTRAAELLPEDHMLHVWKAGILFASNDRNSAEEAVQEALKLNGDEGAVYSALARELKERTPEIAMEYSEKAADIATDQSEHMLSTGDIHMRLGRADSAMECYEKALKLNPACHVALARKAELLLGRRDEESLACIDCALELESGDASYHIIRARILDEMGLGRGDEIMSSLEAALRLKPGDLEYREELVILLKRKGAYIKYFLEKRKLERLRRKQQKEEELARGTLPQNAGEPELV